MKRFFPLAVLALMLAACHPDGPEIESLVMSETSVTLDVQQTRTLQVTVSPSKAKVEDLFWSTTNKLAATVDEQGNVTAVGVGMNAGRSELYSSWDSVRRVKFRPRRGLIKVNGILRRNQVYAAPEDFAFVADYILSHCPNLK